MEGKLGQLSYRQDIHSGEVLTRPRRETSRVADVRFRALLGERAWAKLPQAVRHRFGTYPAKRKPTVYAGIVEETSLNGLGWCLAKGLCLFGAPLPHARHTDPRPASAAISADPATGLQFWTRTYLNTAGFPQVVQSAKAFRGRTGLEEITSSELGVEFNVFEENRSLVFESNAFFLTLFGKKLRLPRLVSPGTLRIEHKDEGGGEFTFSLRLTHPLFGELVFQRARFHDMMES